MSDFASAVAGQATFLGDLLQGLVLLEKDLELEARGAQPIYVVDFAAIFAYAHRIMHEMPSLMWPGEPRDRVMARRQIALELVFTGAQSLVLIPPYAAELRNHVRSITMKLELADLDRTTLYPERLQSLIETSPEFVQFVESIRSNADVSDAVRVAALEVGKKFFPELYAVLDANTADALQRMRKLFEIGALVDPVESIPELTPFAWKGSEPDVDRWFRRLTPLRSKDRNYQTFVDALACAYVQRANALLNEGGRFVLFVAPSFQVRTVLDKEKLVNFGGVDRLSCVRDLDYFLLAVSHKRDLAAVRESVRGIDSLLRTLQSDVDITSARGGLQIAELATEWWRFAENFLLIGSTNLIEGLMLGAAPREAPPEFEFLKLLGELANASRADSSSIERQGLKIIDALKTEIFKLNKWMAPNRTVASFLPLAVERDIDGVSITFPGLQEDAPVTLRFADPAVVVLAKKLHLNARTNVSSLHELRRSVLIATEGQDAHGEHCLLAAYVLAGEGKQDAALREIARGLEIQPRTATAELLYLAGMIRRRLFEPSTAIDTLQRAERLRPRDARLALEYAKACWLQAYFDRPRDLLVSHEWLVKADSLAQRALRLSRRRDPFFKAQIYNVIAFVASEMALFGPHEPQVHIERAAEAVQTVERLVPEQEWIGRFHDTRAWFSFAYATRTAVEVGVKIPTLIRALEDIEKALGRENAIDSRKRLLVEHKAAISEALGIQGVEGEGS